MVDLSMMKKSIRITALILALVMVFTGTASASEFENADYIEVLDYCFPNGSDGSYMSTIYGSGDITFDLPFGRWCNYVEFVVDCDNIGACYVVTNGGTYPLIAVNIGGSLWRLYADAPGFYDTPVLRFNTADGSTSWPTILSFRLYPALTHYSDIARVTAYIGGQTLSGTMPGLRESVTISYGGTNYTYPVLSEGTKFLGYIYLDSWQKYDYMDIRFCIDSFQTTGLCAYIKDIALPLSLQYLDESGSVIFPNSEESETQGIIPSQAMGTEFYEEIQTDYYYAVPNTAKYIIARVDLRGISRNIGYTPVIMFAGTSGNDTFNFTLSDCSGYVVSNNVNPLFYYFNGLKVQLNNLFSVLQSRQDALFNDQIEFHIDMVNSFSQLKSVISSKFSELQSSMESWFDTIRKNMVELTNIIVGKIDALQSSMESWFSTVSGKLDQLIGGTTEGDELSQGAEDLGESVDQIQDYEQSQQAVLDNSLPEIQASVAITGFTAALAFVQRYINLGWSGIGDLSIIYTLPIFIGLFFFICGRLPGVTRWSSRPPKDGGSS